MNVKTAEQILKDKIGHINIGLIDTDNGQSLPTFKEFEQLLVKAMEEYKAQDVRVPSPINVELAGSTKGASEVPDLLTEKDILYKIHELGFDTEQGSSEVCDLMRIAKWVRTFYEDNNEVLYIEIDVLRRQINNLKEENKALGHDLHDAQNMMG